MKKRVVLWGLVFAVLAFSFSTAMADEAESWAAVKVLLEDYDASDEDVQKEIYNYLQSNPEGAHLFEAVLWNIKLTTEFTEEYAAKVLQVLDQIFVEAKEESLLAETLFWKAHLLYGMDKKTEAMDLFARYLSDYPDGARAAETKRIVKLEKKGEETRNAVLAHFRTTLDRLLVNDFSALGMKIKVYPDSFSGELALSRKDGLSLLAGNSWLRFSMYMGNEGLYVCLPDDKKIYYLNSPVHFSPNVNWTAEDLNLGFNLTEANDEKGSIQIDRDTAMATLKRAAGRAHIKKGFGNTFHYYQVRPRVARSNKPGYSLKFDRKGWLKEILLRDDKGEKSVALTHITDKPKVDKTAMTMKDAKRTELSFDQVSFADAGQWFYKKLEKNKKKVDSYDDLWKNKMQIMLYLQQFDSMFEAARKAKSTKEKLAALEEAIAKNPTDPVNYDQKTGYLIDMEQFDEAAESLKRFEELKGDPAIAKVLKIRLLIAKQETQQAYAECSSALEQYPQNARLFMQMAYLLQPTDPMRAVQAATLAASFDPGLKDSYIFLAAIFFNAAQYEPAFHALDLGIEQADEKDELIATKGLFLAQLGQMEMALQTVQPILNNPSSEFAAMAKMVELMAMTKEMAGKDD